MNVRDNPAEARYEVSDDDQVAGFAEYQLAGDTVTFTHTEVDKASQGRGVARDLVTYALDDARTRGRSVIPLCAYVRKVVAEDGYVDLVPADSRGRFGL